MSDPQATPIVSTVPISELGPAIKVAARTRTPLIALGPPGIGKCLAPGTPVLLFSGEIRPVEQIRTGDLLMGPDSQAREVLSTTSGIDHMYRVIPAKGASYVVNAPHVLSLRMSPTGKGEFYNQIVNISVEDYLKQNRTFKHHAKGWRAPGVHFSSFSSTLLSLEPYFLGLWLGDGDSVYPAITTPDEEIRIYLERYAQAVPGIRFRKYTVKEGRCPHYALTTGKHGRNSQNYILNELRHLNLINNKHIPFIYKTATVTERQDLLAGLLDSDGYWGSGCFEIVSVHPRLADDILFLARSLGLAAYMTPKKAKCQTGAEGLYYRIVISGDFTHIPIKVHRKRPTARKQKKDVLSVGIQVKYEGIGPYCGFQLSGDGLFLLGDFTVTHNTQICIQTAEELNFQYAESVLGGRDIGNLFMPFVAPGNGGPAHLVHHYNPAIPYQGNSAFDARPIIYNLDEFTTANRLMQTVLLKVLDEWKIGEAPLREDVIIVATGNRTWDHANVEQLSSALANRGTILHFDPDVDFWISYGIRKNFHPLLFAWIHFDPTNLFSFDPKAHMAGDYPFASPRSNEKLSKLCHLRDAGEISDRLFRAECCGTIGMARGTKFAGFIKIQNELPDFDAILAGKKAKIPDSGGVLYASIAALIQRSTKDNLDNVCRWVGLLPPEWHLQFTKQVSVSAPHLCMTKAWGTWLVEHSSTLS
jgi:hypothetical protein